MADREPASLSRRWRAPGAILLTAALSAPALPLQAAKAPDWVTRARTTSVSPAILQTRPAPDAVVLWRQQIVTAGNMTGSTRLYRREAVKILNADGIGAGTFFSQYDDDSKVSVEGAWTAHADGSAEELDLNQVIAVQRAHAEYFADDYSVAFRPPRLAPGDIAAYALWRKSHRDVYQWELWLQDSSPIAAQEIAIDLPDGWTHAWRLTAVPDGHVGPLTGEGGSKASYLFGPQRAVPKENAAPPERDRYARLQVVVLPPSGKFPELVFRSWKDVGAWFYRKSLPARSDPGDLVGSSREEATAAAARWVQDKIRYVAVEVGEGGYVPREPGVVASRLYGDCKDKAFLLMSLLRRRGVEAFPVLTRPREDGSIDPAFPSPLQFNHVIVAVRPPASTGLASEVSASDGPLVLFDPTDTWTPYGRLPAELQGARGLLVRPDGAELLDLPFAPAEANRLTRAVEAELSAQGGLRARVTETSDGSLSERAYYQSHTPEQRSEWVLRFAESWVPGSRAQDLTLERLDERSSSLESRFTVSAEAYLRKTGALLLLPVLPFSVGPARIPRLEDRRSPIDLGCPRHKELTVAWKLPPGLVLDGTPDPVDADNAYLRYRFSTSMKAGVLLATETYDVKRSVIPLSDLDAWKAIESASAKGGGARAVLVKTP